jgi:hypothetical protein
MKVFRCLAKQYLNFDFFPVLGKEDHNNFFHTKKNSFEDTIAFKTVFFMEPKKIKYAKL